MAEFNAYMPRRTSRKTRQRLLLALAALAVFILFFYNNGVASTSSYAQAAVHRAKPLGSGNGKHMRELRIGKASMLYGRRNELYERALASHDRHNLIHGYPMRVLRRDMTKGYWNKLSWLLSLVVQELAEPEKKRLDWIMWLDVSNILLNHQIPLSALLPPRDPAWDHIHFVGSRKDGDLCGGAFFVRVHPWTITFLIRALALPMLAPEVDEILGLNKDITAIATILNETSFRDNVFYTPRTWFNALDRVPGDDGSEAGGFEGRGGELLVQFPNTMEGAKWKHMADWLEILRWSPDKFVMPFQRTWYPVAIQKFWDRAGEARRALYDGDRKIDDSPPELYEKELLPAVLRLHDAIYFTPFDDTEMVDAIEGVKEAERNMVAPQPE